MFETIAIVGATGAVGRIIRQLLEERDFPYGKIKFLASKRSAGTTVTFKGEEHTVEELTPDAFEGIDLAIGSTPDEVAKDFCPWAVERNCVVVDESGYWRMDPKVPLVVPEVNPEAIDDHQGIISSPNCSTTQMVVAMKPLHDAGRIRRVVVSTYQATSGAGVKGQDDLKAGTHGVPRTATEYKYEAFKYPIAFNLIPQIGSPKHQGYTSEEMKMVNETHKIFGDDSIRVCPTCIRVPVDNCHSESILVETERKITVERGPRAVRRDAGHQGDRRPRRRQVPDARRLRRRRRGVHRPHPRGPVERQRPGVLVRERQPPQGRRDQRRADRRAAGEAAGGGVTLARMARG